MDFSELALRAQVAWFRGLAASGFPQTSAGDGFAVSTGLMSNTENGAVLPPSTLENPDEVDALLVWLREKDVPASVLLTATPTPEAILRLIDRGLEPEIGGDTMGRRLTGLEPDAAGLSAPGWQINEVTDVQALLQNHRVYAEEGWWGEPGELDHNVEASARLGFGPGRPVRHWTAYDQGVPVGAATSFQFDDAVLLASCCVAARRRRRGIGTALTGARLAAAARRGATHAVLFPTPDGYRLHTTLGFVLAPAQPNRWFYMLTHDG